MAKPSKRPERDKRQVTPHNSNALKRQIENNLKRVYDETLNEPLPERLATLLERLKHQDQR